MFLTLLYFLQMNFHLLSFQIYCDPPKYTKNSIYIPIKIFLFFAKRDKKFKILFNSPINRSLKNEKHAKVEWRISKRKV